MSKFTPTVTVPGWKKAALRSIGMLVLPAIHINDPPKHITNADHLNNKMMSEGPEASTFTAYSKINTRYSLKNYKHMQYE